MLARVRPGLENCVREHRLYERPPCFSKDLYFDGVAERTSPDEHIGAEPACSGRTLELDVPPGFAQDDSKLGDELALVEE